MRTVSTRTQLTTNNLRGRSPASLFSFLLFVVLIVRSHVTRSWKHLNFLQHDRRAHSRNKHSEQDKSFSDCLCHNYSLQLQFQIKRLLNFYLRHSFSSDDPLVEADFQVGLYPWLCISAPRFTSARYEVVPIVKPLPTVVKPHADALAANQKVATPTTSTLTISYNSITKPPINLLLVASTIAHNLQMQLTSDSIQNFKGFLKHILFLQFRDKTET